MKKKLNKIIAEILCGVMLTGSLSTISVVAEETPSGYETEGETDEDCLYEDGERIRGVEDETVTDNVTSSDRNINSFPTMPGDIHYVPTIGIGFVEFKISVYVGDIDHLVARFEGPNGVVYEAQCVKKSNNSWDSEYYGTLDLRGINSEGAFCLVSVDAVDVLGIEYSTCYPTYNKFDYMFTTYADASFGDITAISYDVANTVSYSPQKMNEWSVPVELDINNQETMRIAKLSILYPDGQLEEHTIDLTQVSNTKYAGSIVVCNFAGDVVEARRYLGQYILKKIELIDIDGNSYPCSGDYIGQGYLLMPGEPRIEALTVEDNSNTDIATYLIWVSFESALAVLPYQYINVAMTNLDGEESVCKIQIEHSRAMAQPYNVVVRKDSVADGSVFTFSVISLSGSEVEDYIFDDEYAKQFEQKVFVTKQYKANVESVEYSKDVEYSQSAVVNFKVKINGESSQQYLVMANDADDQKYKIELKYTGDGYYVGTWKVDNLLPEVTYYLEEICAGLEEKGILDYVGDFIPDNLKTIIKFDSPYMIAGINIPDKVEGGKLGKVELKTRAGANLDYAELVFVKEKDGSYQYNTVKLSYSEILNGERILAGDIITEIDDDVLGVYSLYSLKAYARDELLVYYSDGYLPDCVNKYYEVVRVDRPYSDKVGNDVRWVINDEGALIISGTGATYDYNYSFPVFYDYRDDIYEIIIEDGVTEIGDRLFWGLGNVKGLSIPEGVTSLGDYAFCDCDLKYIEVKNPDCVIGTKAVGYKWNKEKRAIEPIKDFVVAGLSNSSAETYATRNSFYFGWSSSLTVKGEVFCVNNYDDVYVGGTGCVDTVTYLAHSPVPTFGTIRFLEGITEIGDNAIKDLINVYRVYMADSILRIGNKAFYGLICDTDISLPNKLVSIGDEAFGSSCRIVAIPDSVTSIGKKAFYSMRITSVKLPDALTYLGEEAFRGCYYLKEVFMPTGIIEIPDGAFAECRELVSINIPSSVTRIGDEAFRGCAITSLDIPDTLIEIGDSAFENTALEHIDLPDGLQQIGSYAFKDCDGLKSICIPQTVTVMGTYAVGYYYSYTYFRYNTYADFEILGKRGSIAQKYAYDNSITFVGLDTVTYGITYVLDGGINDDQNISRYTEDLGAFELLAPQKAGYVFKGWYTDSDYFNQVTVLDDNRNSDIVIYAKWDFLYAPYGYKVSLGSDFKLEYYLELADYAINNDSVFVEFTIDGDIVNARPDSVEGDYAIYNCEVPIKSISSVIELRLYYDGAYYELPNYSVRDYLETIIANKEDVAEYAYAKDLAVALLDFGAYAQVYFGCNAGNLANSRYSSGMVEALSATDIAREIDNGFYFIDNSDFSYIGASLVCYSDIWFKVYFRNNNGLTSDEISEKYEYHVLGGREIYLSVEVTNDTVCFTIKGIPAVELDNDYYLMINDKLYDDNTAAVKHSPFLYLKQAMNSNDEALVNLCKALYLYEQEAAYFTIGGR